MVGMKMTMLETRKTTSLPSGVGGRIRLRERINQSLLKIMDCVSRIVSPVDVDSKYWKDEVWTDLSRVYYKYESVEQKRAFREVMHEMLEKVSEGHWESIYKKLYRIEQRKTP